MAHHGLLHELNYQTQVNVRIYFQNCNVFFVKKYVYLYIIEKNLMQLVTESNHYISSELGVILM